MHRFAIMAAFTGLLSCCLARAEDVASQLPAGRQWKLAWHDEFNGSKLDRTKWDYRLHIMGTRHQTFTNAGVTVSDGCCHLKIIEKDGQYYSPHLQTGNNFFDFPLREKKPDGGISWPFQAFPTNHFLHRYGYWECRCRTQKKSGWWSAFWIQAPFIGASDNPGLTGAELDVMESFTTNSVRCGNVGIGGYGPNSRWWGTWDSKGLPKDRNTPMNDTFHTYGVWWTPMSYTFYIDGKSIGTLNKSEWISHIPEFALISTECKGYRKGTRDKPSEELSPDVAGDEFTVDYVRVFDEVGPVQHELVLADESRAQLRYVNPFEPEKSCSIPVEKPVWDLQKVGETKYRVIGQSGFLVADIATRSVCDTFKSKDLNGVTSVSDLPDGGFLACVNHPNTQKQVDILRFSKNRELINRTVFKGIFYARMMTRLPNGELLLTHDNGMIRAKVPEQGGEGIVLQTFAQPRSRNTFQGIPSVDGSGYWVGVGYGAELVFYGLDGKVKKTFAANQPDGLQNFFYAQPFELPNGNIVVANWNGHNADDSKKGWQVIEFDKEGKVVWYLHDPEKYGSVSSVYVIR